MTRDDVQWCIDTLKREEDILHELKDKAREGRRATDRHDAQMFDEMARQLFGVRQLLEVERSILARLKRP